MAYNGKEGTSRRNRRYHEQHDTPIVYDDRSEDEHAEMVLTPFGQTSVENVDRRQVETEFDLSEDQFADLDNLRSISDEQAFDYGNQLAMGANDALPEDARYWTEQDFVAVRAAEQQIADNYAAKAATVMGMLTDDQKARLDAGEEIGRGSARLQMDGDTLLYTDGKAKATYPLSMDHIEKVAEEGKQAKAAEKAEQKAQQEAAANQRVNDHVSLEIQQEGGRSELLRSADDKGRAAIQTANQKAGEHVDFLQTVETIDSRLTEEANLAFYEQIKASVAAQENEGKEISPSNSEQTAEAGSQSSYSLTAAERLKVQGDGATINDASYYYRYDQATDTIGRFETDGTPAGRRSFDELHAHQIDARNSRHDRAEAVEQSYKDRGEERPQTAVEELRAMGEGGEMTFGKHTYRLDFETNEVVRFDDQGNELRRVGAQEIQDFQVLKMEERRIEAEQAQQTEAAQPTEQQPVAEAPTEPQFDAPTFEEQTVDMDAVQHSREQAAALDDQPFEQPQATAEVPSLEQPEAAPVDAEAFDQADSIQPQSEQAMNKNVDGLNTEKATSEATTEKTVDEPVQEPRADVKAAIQEFDQTTPVEEVKTSSEHTLTDPNATPSVNPSEEQQMEQREDVKAALQDFDKPPEQTPQEQGQKAEQATAQHQPEATSEVSVEGPQQRPDVAAAMAEFEDDGKPQEGPAKVQEQASEMGSETSAPEQSEAPQEEQRADVQAAMDDFEAETSAPRSEPAQAQDDEQSMAA